MALADGTVLRGLRLSSFEVVLGDDVRHVVQVLHRSDEDRLDRFRTIDSYCLLVPVERPRDIVLFDAFVAGTAQSAQILANHCSVAEEYPFGDCPFEAFDTEPFLSTDAFLAEASPGLMGPVRFCRGAINGLVMTGVLPR
ncbi:MAG: hypothetical protein AAGH15_03150 [Myxococcota bacterium]